MLNDPDWQHVFIDVINLMGSNHDLLSCWWHFDHCINMAIRLEVEAETQWITAKNLFGRLQLLNIDEKIWPIIVVEHRQIPQEMANNCDPLIWEPSEMSEPVPLLEYSYPQQSWSTSPTTLITMFKLQITNQWWAWQTPYEKEGCTLWEIQIRTPFVGHPSTSDLESPN